MLSSRGLRPAQFTPLASRSSLSLRSTSRQLSTVPRHATLLASRRASPVHSSKWRTGALPSNNLPSVSSVRYGSWYAPWTWGRSSTPASDASQTVPVAEFSNNPPPTPEPLAATPKLEPAAASQPAETTSAAVDAAPAVNGTPTSGTNMSLDEVLEKVEASNVMPDTAGVISHIPYFGYLKQLGLDYGWGPTAFFEWIFEHTYVWTGAGFGASIIVSTIAIRILSIYFNAKSSDNMAKMAALRPLTELSQQKLNQAMMNRDVEAQRRHRNELSLIYKETGVKPWKGFVGPLMQGVLGFGAFRFMRGAASLPAPGMSDGGYLWFTDLTASDPYYILPVVTGGVMHLFAKMGGESGVQGSQVRSPGAQFTMQYGLPLFLVVVTTWQPAGLQMYFLTSTILGLVTGRLLRVPALREKFGIAPIPNKESEAFWTKVAKGEIPLKSLPKDANNNVVMPKEHAVTYQAPSTASSKKSTLRLKSGAAMAHPSYSSSTGTGTGTGTGKKTDIELDLDFQQGPPSDVKGKLKWIGRNYRPGRMVNRLMRMGEKSGLVDSSKYTNDPKEVQKRKDEEYELRRKERLRRY